MKDKRDGVIKDCLKNGYLNKMKFLIIGTQRSGTMLLTTFLNSHPDLNVYTEESLAFANTMPSNYGANFKYNQLSS